MASHTAFFYWGCVETLATSISQMLFPIAYWAVTTRKSAPNVLLAYRPLTITKPPFCIELVPPWKIQLFVVGFS